MTDNLKKPYEIDPRDDYYSRTMEVIRALRRQGRNDQADQILSDLKTHINKTTKWEKR